MNTKGELMYKWTIIAAASFAVATPALADEPYAVTPSGGTEAYYAMGVTETSDMLANHCLDFGWQMQSSTDTVVVCEVPMSLGSTLLSALAAPRYSTPPKEFIRFNLAGVQGNTRVQASGWRETQTAFGQTQQTDLASDNYHNTVMTFFEGSGGVYPQGTMFPNHALGGFGYEVVERPAKALKLTELTEGGAFDQAGLQPGDLVLKIAGERTKDTTDILDALHKAAKYPTYQVQFLRDGQKQEVDVERVYRPTIDQRLEPRMAESDEAMGSTTIVEATSIADELAKFAKLRDDGIITDAEFEAQKAKLLDQ